MLKYVFETIKRGVLKINTLRKNRNSQFPFSIYPDTDFKKHTSDDPNRIMKRAWERTGKQMYDAITQVGEEISSERKRKK